MELVYQPVAEWFADPNGVGTSNYCLDNTDDDAIAFVITNNWNIYFSEPQMDHESIINDYGLIRNKIIIEGRFWEFDKVISFWSWSTHDLSPLHFPSSDELRDIVELCASHRYNIGNYQILKATSAGNSLMYMCMPIGEYIQRGFTGNEEFDDLYNMWEIQEKKKNMTKIKPEGTALNGINKKDFWRHYEMVGESIKLNESDLAYVIKEVAERLSEADRHRPGYYKDYAKKTGKKDRHKPGYYHKYNQEHPERLERGFTKGYIDGKVSNGPKPKVNGNIWYDYLGRPHSNDPYNPTFSDLLDAKEQQWHDDDWEESSWDD